MALTTLQTNMPAVTAQRNLRRTQGMLESSLNRLSSGYRINSAADDAAGLAVSESLRSQVRGLERAIRNANDGLSVVNVAESGLNEVSNILIRMRELAVEAASDGISDVERSFLMEEFSALREEIDRISVVTEYNGTRLIDGSLSAVGLEFQVGVRNQSVDRISLSLSDMAATSLGILTSAGVETKLQAQGFLSTVDNALTQLSSERARLGAFANRLSTTINNLSIVVESLSAAHSRIRDTDVARESADLARSQVLVQAGMAMLSQANTQPYQLTKLIGGG